MPSLLPILTSYLRTRWLEQRFHTRADLEDWQEGQVQRFLTAILPMSPFYASAYGERPIAGWRSWPLMDKTQMMENFDRLNTLGVTKAAALAVAQAGEASRNFGPMVGDVTVGLSSGTSGNRGLFIAATAERLRWSGAVMAKVLPGPLWQRQRVGLFLRANSNLYASVQSRRITFAFYDLLRPLEEHIRRLNQYQPTILAGPPLMLLLLARAQQSGALTIRPIKIYSVAETLDPLDERTLAGAFDQRIHQIYQCTEGFLASTCSHGVLHLHEEFVAFQPEWLDEAAGKFVPILTDFSRTSQPIIRYRLNDILTLRRSPCPCGRVTQALEQIEGRCDDLFYFAPRSPTAQLIPVFPDFMRKLVIDHAPAVEEYRIRQLEVEQVEVALRVAPDAQQASELAVRTALLELCRRIEATPPHLAFVPLPPLAAGPRKLKRVEQCGRGAR
jgi:putative adenylate-forming enzyme